MANIQPALVTRRRHHLSMTKQSPPSHSYRIKFDGIARNGDDINSLRPVFTHAPIPKDMPESPQARRVLEQHFAYQTEQKNYSVQEVLNGELQVRDMPHSRKQKHLRVYRSVGFAAEMRTAQTAVKQALAYFKDHPGDIPKLIHTDEIENAQWCFGAHHQGALNPKNPDFVPVKFPEQPVYAQVPTSRTRSLHRRAGL